MGNVFRKILNCLHHTHTQRMHGAYPAFSPIHRLLLKALPDFEVDLRGADGGGGFDVELVPILANLHMWLGGSCHSHFPQHGIDTCAQVEKEEGEMVQSSFKEANSLRLLCARRTSVVYVRG